MGKEGDGRKRGWREKNGGEEKRKVRRLSHLEKETVRKRQTERGGGDEEVQRIGVGLRTVG